MSSNFNRVYFEPMEKMVKIVQDRVQNKDSIFFRLILSYYFAKIASMMRCSVELPGHRTIPVNFYGINLSPSGSGKGHSIRLIEDAVINQFRQQFLRKTFPHMAKKYIEKIALRRSIMNNTDPDTEKLQAEAEFELCGPLLFSFDSATTAAIKQMRTKLQMANGGSMNFEMDEIGSNLLGNNEALNAFLELYDVGQIKPKLVKHTRENQRGEDLHGPTPTNMMLFGTPAKLLNGTKIEEEFYDFLQIGYARRCFFGYSRVREKPENRDVYAMRDMLNDTASVDYMAKLSARLAKLADPANFHVELKMMDDVEIAFLQYQLDCEGRAARYSEYQEMKRTEMEHRHFKTIKLAAAYAFIDASIYVTIDHWNFAKSMAEESGEAFHSILQRDRPYAKLAHYIASMGEQLTQSDLVEDLPFYKGTEYQKREMMNLAISHGYRQGIYIKRELGTDGIEFFSGKSVPPTDLNEMIVSWSDHAAYGYKSERPAFNKLYQLTNRPGLHWANHVFQKGHRCEDSAIIGCNLAVIDVDDEADLDTVKMLLEDYKWLIHTTKRHTDTKHRFRVIFPLSHELELDAPDYREFMINIYDWLPFGCDRQTNQRSRKWLTNKGKYWYNKDGELLDALQFVPQTKKAEERKQVIATQGSLSNLERWFINSTEEGNRNKSLHRYAMCLVDMGQDMDSIRNNVMAMNTKLDIPLPEAEIISTIIFTANKKFHERNKGK